MNEFFRKRRVGDHYVLTDDQGNHILLDPDEYRSFRTGNIDDQLKSKLEGSGILDDDETAICKMSKRLCRCTG